MSSFFSGNFIKRIRNRKQLTQGDLLYMGESSDGTISRVENGRQSPTNDTLETFMDKLGFAKDAYFCPYLENQTFEALFIRQKIYEAIECGETQAAKNLLNRLEDSNLFQKGVNLQFVLSCRIRIALLENIINRQIIESTLDAIRLTFPEFNEESFSGEALLFEEPYLICSLAVLYRYSGEQVKAMRLLDGLQKSIELSPTDNYIKEKILSLTMLFQARTLINRIQLASGDNTSLDTKNIQSKRNCRRTFQQLGSIDEKYFEQALLCCNKGIDVSLKWSKGKDVPDLLYQKAICLMELGRNAEYPDILKQAYASYTLLGRKQTAAEVLENARTIFHVNIEPLEIDTDFSGIWGELFNAETEISGKCEHVGDLLFKLREIAGIKQKAVYSGICSPANYSKIENGDVEPNFFFLEAFMQRLGRDVNHYMDTFLSAEDFFWKQKKRDVYAYLSLKKVNEAEILIKELEADKKFKTNINLQFILSAKASILNLRQGSNEEYTVIILKALKRTIPDFNEEKIESYRLTYDETLLVNKLACTIARSGDRRRAIKVFERLKTCMDRTYIHNAEKSRTYEMILYNYSKQLGLEERYKEALEIIDIGERMCVQYQHLNLLPPLMINRACDLLELGRREQSIPYFILSYYGSMAINEVRNGEIIKAYVEEKLNIGIVD